MLTQLKSESLMETSFGQDLMFMMEMKGPAVDSIVNLLDGLKANVVEKQDKANEEHTKKNNEWNKEIKELEDQIAELTADISKLTQEIGKLAADLVAAIEKLANLRKQLSLLKSKQASLVKARNEDEASYKKRSAQQSRVEKALAEIIHILSARLAQGKQGFIQKEEILDVLQKIGSNNPFAALVEFTMSFDVKDVKHVISKLDDLRKAVAASLVEDARLEVISVTNYVELVTEMNKVHANLD
jgi:chromosome segregation ATPase